MTFWDLLAILRRNWPALIIGGVLTLIAVGYLYTRPPVYLSRVAMVMSAPANARFPNALGPDQPSGLIEMAGIVGKLVDPSTEPKVTNPQMSLVDQGEYNAFSVKLPDSGGQWAANFEKPELDVQVSGPSSADVTARMTELVQKIKDTTLKAQEDVGAPKNQIVTTRMDPGTLPVFELRGSSKRMIFGALILGVWGSVMLAVLMDFRRRHKDAGRAVRSDKELVGVS